MAIRIRRAKLIAVIPTIPHPPLLFSQLPLLPTRPPPLQPQNAGIKHSNSQDHHNIARIVRRIAREIKSKPAVDQSKEEHDRTEVLVDFGEGRGGLGLLPCAVVEETKGELEEKGDDDQEPDDLVGGGEAVGLMWVSWRVGKVRREAAHFVVQC